MVVMLIIGLLASILVPSLGAVRTKVKEATTKTLIFTLGSAIDMFRSDDKVGGAYPPSYWNMNTGGDPYGSSPLEVTGAQTLVWAVVGPKLTGVAAFEADASRNLHDRYDNSTGDPLQGPFIDPSKLEVVKLSDSVNCEFLARPGVTGPPVGWYDDAPVIVDAFGMPILYYRPNTGDNSGNIYTMLPRADNALITNVAAVSEITDNTSFSNYFSDTRATGFGASERPKNFDSFILLSAGADRTYGPLGGDDISNCHD
jgi:type II secretory pathway pseudopilin PulG